MVYIVANHFWESAKGCEMSAGKKNKRLLRLRVENSNWDPEGNATDRTVGILTASAYERQRK
jgi:hypothetical protein